MPDSVMHLAKKYNANLPCADSISLELQEVYTFLCCIGAHGELSHTLSAQMLYIQCSAAR